MILENMDLTADPCENFYEFTCGGFVNKTRLADNQQGLSTFGQLANSLTQVLSGKHFLKIALKFFMRKFR